VPGANGQLVCQMACSPSASACTVDADCCSGLHCYAAVGSTSGACGEAPPPPSGYDAGAPPASGCSFYGQSCTQNSDCLQRGHLQCRNRGALRRSPRLHLCDSASVVPAREGAALAGAGAA
jgi:hypothetical protein